MSKSPEADAFVRGQEGIEMAMARRITRRVLWVGPLVVLGFLPARGWRGAGSAAAGVAIVVGLFLLTGLIMSAAAKVSITAIQGAALMGFVLRLGLIAAVMYGLAAVAPVDRLALGVSVVVAYLSLLLLEFAAYAGESGNRA
jgi:hypothetical protein